MSDTVSTTATTERWRVDPTLRTVEHLRTPRCRFFFEQDVAGAWWCVETAWIDDPFGESAEDVKAALALANQLMREARAELAQKVPR